MGGMRFVVAAVLTALLTPAAHAAEVRATGPDGRPLRVGSVVAVGERTGGSCVFPDDTVTLSAASGGSAAVAVRADDACRLVVTYLGKEGPGRSADVNSRRPKVDETTPSAPDTAALTPELGPPSPDTLVEVASSKERVLVKLSQTVYNESKARQYEDSVDVTYLRDRRTGAMSVVEPYDGYCLGDLMGDLVYATVEIRNCFYKTLYAGPDRVGFVSGGYYRQVAAGVERDARKLTETYNVYRNQVPTRVCSTGGALPLLWTNYCFLDVN